MPASRAGYAWLPLILVAFHVVPAAPVQAQDANPGAGSPGKDAAGKRVELAITYDTDVNGVIAGTRRSPPFHQQRVGATAKVDLEQWSGWRGAELHVSLHAIVGRGLSASRLHNLLAVSGTKAEPSLRLGGLWLEQRVGRAASIRVGKFAADHEFMVSPTAGLFVNVTFGWPGSFAADLPSGGPAYPLTAPDLRLALGAGKSPATRLAVFAGDPADPGRGDPQSRDRHGLNGFRWTGAPLLIAEHRQELGPGRTYYVSVGGWAHLGRFPGVVRSPAAAGRLASFRGDHALYLMLERAAARTDGRALGAFARISISPSDRNTVDRYVDGGVAVTGLLAGRPSDTFGVGGALALLSRRGQAAVPGQRWPRGEAVIETSYRVQLDSRTYLQPNIQWIIDPTCPDANPAGNAGVGRSRGALVVGLRFAASR